MSKSSSVGIDKKNTIKNELFEIETNLRDRKVFELHKQVLMWLCLNRLEKRETQWIKEKWYSLKVQKQHTKNVAIF